MASVISYSEASWSNDFQMELLFGFIDAIKLCGTNEVPHFFKKKKKIKMVICLHKVLSDLTFLFGPMVFTFYFLSLFW